MALKLSKDEWERSEGIRDLRARAASLDTLVTEKDALIERLQKELGEAREANDASVVAGFVGGMEYSEKLVRFRDGVGTDPEAANCIRQHRVGTGRMNGLTGEEAAANFARSIRAKAIRSIDGGGK